MRYLLSCVTSVCIVLLMLTGCGAKRVLPPADYTLTVETLNTRVDGVGVTLRFPSVSGYRDPAVESLVNECLKENAWVMFRLENLVPGEDYTFEYSVSEVVATLVTEGFFSACVGGIIAEETSGRMEYFSYTINCDIESGILYKSEDLLSAYDTLYACFEQGKFAKLFGHEALLENVSCSDLILPYDAAYEIYPDVFFTDTDMGFLIEVVPTLGGYAGFTLPLRTASKYMNTDNPMVRSITGK